MLCCAADLNVALDWAMVGIFVCAGQAWSIAVAPPDPVAAYGALGTPWRDGLCARVRQRSAQQLVGCLCTKRSTTCLSSGWLRMRRRSSSAIRSTRACAVAQSVTLGGFNSFAALRPLQGRSLAAQHRSAVQSRSPVRRDWLSALVRNTKMGPLVSKSQQEKVPPFRQLCARRQLS